MSDIVIYSKLQRLIVDPPSRTVSVVPAGNVTKEALDLAIAATPKGALKLHSLTTAFATVAPHTNYQDDGLTCTITELPGRLLRVQVTTALSPSGGIQTILYQILRSGVVVKGFVVPDTALAVGFSLHRTFTFFYNTGAGGANVVWKTQIKGWSANTVVNSNGGVGDPRQMVIEDIGPTPT